MHVIASKYYRNILLKPWYQQILIKKHGDTCEDMKYLYNPANKYFPNDQCPVIKSYMD